MKVGDLVRMNPDAADRVAMPEASESGIVVESWWPNDDGAWVSVFYPDGREENWYDWQLEIISESR